MARRKKSPTAQKELLTVADVAVLLDVCPNTVYNLIYNHGLPSLVLDKHRRIIPESLKEWLKQREQHPA